MNLFPTPIKSFVLITMIGCLLTGNSNIVSAQQAVSENDPFNEASSNSVNEDPFGGQLSAIENDDIKTLFVRMYKLDDLLVGSDDRTFRGFALPGVSDGNEGWSSRPQFGGGMGGGMGGGGVGGGGMVGGMGGGGMMPPNGSGGGVFCVPARLPWLTSAPVNSPQFGDMDPNAGGLGFQFTSDFQPLMMDDLMDAIAETVAVETWADFGEGGNGTMKALGTILIVSQTHPIHEQIETFLTLLRQTRHADRTPLTIKAVWLTIDEAQLQTLGIDKNQTVNKEALSKLAASHGRRGQVSCFDRQTVHIAAGNLKSSVESVIPVVGQLDAPSELDAETPFRNVSYPTQIENSKPADGTIWVAASAPPRFNEPPVQNAQGRAVGYQPITRWINYGTVLQVTPHIDASEQTITVDLISLCVYPNGGEDDKTAPENAAGFPQVDLHNIRCQQLETSARLLDGKPMLVGGSAVVTETGENMQTYLILEAVIGE